MSPVQAVVDKSNFCRPLLKVPEYHFWDMGLIHIGVTYDWVDQQSQSWKYIHAGQLWVLFAIYSYSVCLLFFFFFLLVFIPDIFIGSPTGVCCASGLNHFGHMLPLPFAYGLYVSLFFFAFFPKKKEEEKGREGSSKKGKEEEEGARERLSVSSVPVSFCKQIMNSIRWCCAEGIRPAGRPLMDSRH
ncbi:hypothetical protein CEXT_435031 [Caerostris extrusa]|uniref:Uncharacterized protein n=1 Tax=Caerostris extrusa TaxID=172846 RepID=A0AAV4RRF5_CAEEX|nr:hypothetical protein CEXT_435031 [Caerostris extrusa]